MKIRMLKTVRPDFMPFPSTPGTVLRVNEKYNATANKNGAVSGICLNGERLRVKPGEFKFVSLPKRLYDIWAPKYPHSVEHAEITEEE